MPNSNDDRSSEGFSELIADVLAGDEVELDLLLQHANAPDSLSADERRRVEEYLAASPAHRDRARVMTRLAASGDILASLGAVPDPARGIAGANVIPLRRFSRLSIPLALAASIAITLLGVGYYVRLHSNTSLSPPQLAEETAPAPTHSDTGLEGEVLEGFDRSTLLAEEVAESEPSAIPAPVEGPELHGEPNVVRPDTSLADASLAIQDGPAPRESIERSGSSPSEPTAKERSVERLEESEPILLAAMLSAGAFDYVEQPGLMDLVRIEGHLRSSAGQSTTSAPLSVTTLAPRHRGLTLEASPTLFWFVSRGAGLRQEVAIINMRDRLPILEVVLPATDAAGIVSLNLMEHGVELVPGIDYRWVVAVVHDPNRRARDTVASAEIRRVESSQEIASALDRLAPEGRGQELARRGIWYDSLAILSAAIAQHPEAPGLRAMRADLLAAEGLEAAAHFDRAAGMNRAPITR